MRRDSQGSFPRLAIVGSHNKSAQTTSLPSPGCQAQIAERIAAERRSTEQPAVTTNGLTVMPQRSLRGPLPMLWALWTTVRTRLLSQRRNAAVLAFRGHALLAPLSSAAPAGENTLEKKASESVRWESDRSTVSQEEGRG